MVNCFEQLSFPIRPQRFARTFFLSKIGAYMYWWKYEKWIIFQRDSILLWKYHHIFDIIKTQSGMYCTTVHLTLRFFFYPFQIWNILVKFYVKKSNHGHLYLWILNGIISIYLWSIDAITFSKHRLFKPVPKYEVSCFVKHQTSSPVFEQQILCDWLLNLSTNI